MFQGGKLAVVSPGDLVKLLMNHPKMHALRTEAGNALVLIETGAVEGMTRLVQAATAPTEGQRVLQNGYRGAIANGESREQVSATISADGLLTHQRLVERSVVLPDGEGLRVQQVQQAVVVQGDPAIGDLARHMITMSTGIGKLAALVQFKTSELEAKDAELEARISFLEGKRRRVDTPSVRSKNAHWIRADHPELPKNIQGRNGMFGWKRSVNGKSDSKQGFSSIALAQASMCDFYSDTGAVDGAVCSQSTIDQWCALTGC